MLLKKTIFQSPKLATRFPLSRFRSQTRQVPRPPCPQARWAPRAVLPPSPRVGPEAPRCRLSPTPSRIPRGRGAALQPWPRTLAMLGWPGSGRPGADFQKEPCEGAPPGGPRSLQTTRSVPGVCALSARAEASGETAKPRAERQKESKPTLQLGERRGEDRAWRCRPHAGRPPPAPLALPVQGLHTRTFPAHCTLPGVSEGARAGGRVGVLPAQPRSGLGV